MQYIRQQSRLQYVPAFKALLPLKQMITENADFHFGRAAHAALVDTQESLTPSLFPWLSAGFQAQFLILLTTNRSYYSMKDIFRDTG